MSRQRNIVITCCRIHPTYMNTLDQIPEILHLLRSLIRIGTVSALKLDDGLCRVDTGNNTTGWLHWLTARAGKIRSSNTPSVSEQVLVLCLGSEFDTGFVLPGIYLL